MTTHGEILHRCIVEQIGSFLPLHVCESIAREILEHHESELSFTNRVAVEGLDKQQLRIIKEGMVRKLIEGMMAENVVPVAMPTWIEYYDPPTHAKIITMRVGIRKVPS